MPLDLNIDTRDLMKWSRLVDQVSRRTNPALARSLNTVGDGVVRAAAQYIADQSGLDPNDVAELIKVKPATADDLSWEMDASAIAPPSLDWSRPWEKPEGGGQFEQNTLVKILTFEDETVCIKCQEAAEQSPYTLEEAQHMLPIHPNCRCVIGNWSSMRRLPVRFGAEGAGGAPPQLFTVRQLGRAVAGEMEVVMRVTGS